MKTTIHLFYYVIIASLVLFSIKPLLRHGTSPQSLATMQYSTVNKCSGGVNTALSSCQTSTNYTLAEWEISADLYSLIFAGLLFFVYKKIRCFPPYFRLFKPPILSC